MSTKVYNFYEYKGKGGITNLYKWLVRLRERQIDHTISFIRGFVEKTTDENRKEQFRKVEERILETTKKGFNDPFNIESSVVVYTYKDRLFVQFFGVEEKLYKYNTYLKDTHYQNQTDQPEEVSDKAWKDRRKLVDEIFENEGRPSRCGLIFQILDSWDAWEIARKVIK